MQFFPTSFFQRHFASFLQHVCSLTSQGYYFEDNDDHINDFFDVPEVPHHVANMGDSRLNVIMLKDFLTSYGSSCEGNPTNMTLIQGD